MSEKIHDLIIIGGGPAGAAAGVYAARKKLDAILVTADFGGQSVASARIENWIGSIAIGGAELAIALEDHLRAHPGLTIREPEKAAAIEKQGAGFLVRTDKGEYTARAVLLATGARHRKLDVPGSAEFDGRGIAYCSTCDAPLFQGKAVAVIGSGNAGLEAAYDLRDYARAIHILDIASAPTGDRQTAETVLGLAKVDFLPAVKVTAITGDSWIRGLKYRPISGDEEKTLPVEGVFVAIGAAPNAEIARGLVDLNERGEIIVKRPSYATSRPGIFAAGDVTDEPFRQNNIAAGDAIKAVLSACAYLKEIKA